MAGVKDLLKNLFEKYNAENVLPVSEIEELINANELSLFEAEVLISRIEASGFETDADPYLLLPALFSQDLSAESVCVENPTAGIYFSTESLTALVHSINQIPRLSAQEECNLIRSIKNGDTQARSRLIEANLRVAYGALKAMPFIRNHPNFEDYLQESFLALGDALDKFDPDRRYRFSTYAVFWVRKAAYKALSKDSRGLCSSQHEWAALKEIKEAKAELEQTMMAEPSFEDIAKKVNKKPAYVAGLLLADQYLLSLDETIGDESDGISLKDTIGDEKMSNLEADFILSQTTANAIDSLLEHEKNVLNLRMGRNNGKTCTLEETAKALSMTMQDVRQIEAMALRKLKHKHNIELFL